MSFCYKVFILLTLVSLKSFCFSSEIECKIFDLGTLNASSSEAISINDKGEVLGRYELEGKNIFFVWSELDGLKPLDTPYRKGENTVVKKINNLGQVVGYVSNKDLGNGTRGFIVNRNGESTILDRYFKENGLENCQVMDINDKGQVTGFIYFTSVNSKAKRIPFIWDGGKIVPLSLKANDTSRRDVNGMAVSINNNGDIVGSVSFNSKIPPFKHFHAVVWEYKNYFYTDLHHNPVGVDSETFDINNSNIIVGRVSGCIALWNKDQIFKIMLRPGKFILKINNLCDELRADYFNDKDHCKQLWLGRINELISKEIGFEKVEKFIDFNNNREIIAEVKMLDGRHHGILIKIIE